MIKKLVYTKHRMLGTLAITIYVVGILPFSFSSDLSNESMHSTTVTMKRELTSLENADAWINSTGFTEEKLKGKVVLIEFCTYTCINWLRTMPWVRAWNEKYRNMGLEVICVHTPEFPFEKNIDNVRRSMADMKIDIPVAIDNNYSIWKAFNNQYWPAMYFIDGKGFLRHTKFGEGDYDESEKVIQFLLKEAGNKNINENLVTVNAQGIEIASDQDNLNSQENYLGYERTEDFSSRGAAYGRPHNYAASANLGLNAWALSGNWTVDKKSITLNESNGKIIYNFHARDIHVVMGCVSSEAAIRFRLFIDGRPPGSAHGIDTDEQGNGIIKGPRLYQLIRQQSTIIDHEMQIEFLDAGAEVFSFTFG